MVWELCGTHEGYESEREGKKSEIENLNFARISQSLSKVIFQTHKLIKTKFTSFPLPVLLAGYFHNLQVVRRWNEDETHQHQAEGISKCWINFSKKTASHEIIRWSELHNKHLHCSMNNFAINNHSLEDFIIIPFAVFLFFHYNYSSAARKALWKLVGKKLKNNYELMAFRSKMFLVVLFTHHSLMNKQFNPQKKTWLVNMVNIQKNFRGGKKHTEHIKIEKRVWDSPNSSVVALRKRLSSVIECNMYFQRFNLTS